MNINFQNNTYYKQLMLVCDGRKYILNKGLTLPVYTNSNRVHLTVYVSDKNRVMLNWLFILIDGFVDDESVINALQCNTEFDLCFPDTCVCETISIEDIEARDTNQCIYSAVYLNNNNMTVNRCRDFIKEWKKQKRKASFYHIVITSALPILLFVLGCFFIQGNIWAGVSAILILVFFSIPSWLKATRLKRFYDDANAHTLLCMQDMMQRQNGGNPVVNEPTDFIGKTVWKVLDKIFSKKK